MTINLSALQKQRRDTAANWTAENPTLLAGEIGLESDTGYWKVGDGATAWTSLAYVSGLGAEIPVDRLADGAARQLLQTDAAGTGVEWTDNVDVPGTLDVTGTGTFDGNVTIAGDLTVNGTTTTINTQDLLVEDKNIIIGNVTTPSDVTADGGGITLKGTTDKTINWVDSTDAWTLSEHVDLASGKEYRIAGTKVLDATSLGSAVVSSSLTSVGTIGTGVWQGTAIDAAYLDSTVVTTGDTGTVTSTMIADGTIVDADVNASAAIAGTKISPDFGAQNVTTTGTSTAASFTPTSSTVPTNGVYLPAANSVALSTNGTKRIEIQADGDIDIDSGGVFYDATNNRLAIGTTSPLTEVQIGSDGYTGELASGYRTLSIADTTNGAQLQLRGLSPKLFFDSSSGGNGEIYMDSTALAVFSGTPNTPGSERARIDSSGRLLVGTSSSRGNWFNTTGADPQLQIESSSVPRLSITRNNGGVNAGELVFGNSRSSDYAVVSDNDSLGRISFQGADGSEMVAGAYIQAFVDGTPGANDMPGRIVLSTTADGASSPTERMRIEAGGVVRIPSAYSQTTANAANLHVLADGSLVRSTSSAKYKTDVETIQNSYADALLQCRPVWYRSTCECDNPDWGWWGFIAEEVAAIDPRLVHWKTVEVSYDKNGSVVETPCEPEPEGVQYDRFVPHLLNLIKRQQQAIETLEAKVAAFESA